MRDENVRGVITMNEEYETRFLCNSYKVTACLPACLPPGTPLSGLLAGTFLLLPSAQLVASCLPGTGSLGFDFIFGATFWRRDLSLFSFGK